IEGNQRAVKDERKKPDGTKEQRIVMRYDYYMAGPEENENGATPNRIHQASMEAGERWILNDVAGNPIRAWDSRGHEFRTAYDQLRRPIESRMSEGAGPELLVGRTVYGETRPTPEAHNLRGQVVQLFDQAGVVTTDPYDFKGNLLSSRRQLAQEYKTTLNWSATVPLEAATYTSRTTYDALNRPVSSISPDGSIYLPTFNEANLLERVDANLRGAMDAVGQPVWTPFVTNIDYDAKGQRTLIEYGNVVQTKYEYDPKTFRLTHLLTKRDAAAFPNDCPNPPPTNWPGCQVQNLHYTYDPVGNISHIRDDAQQTIYFKNKRVEPSAEYTYDAIYRLIQATGREHLGQGGTPIPHSHNDAERTGLLTADAAGRFSPSDGNAMGRYCEKYVYDAVGNFLQMSHHRSCPDIPSWTRIYTYDEASLIEPAKQSNRLSSTALGNNNPSPDRYVHDAHGNMTRMPHLGGAHPTPNLHWDHKDQLRQADLGGGGTAYYTYDSAGQRVRKVIESQNGSLKSERIYLSGFEIYKQHSGIHAGLERETLHIMDGQQRIALVETRTQGTDPAPAQLIRYQFGNHLGSASMELDDQAHIISYEEYTPYGSTSYQAVRNQTETPKRYRYTGKERDEENGLYYYGARYYAAWLGRWTIADPVGLADGTNVYSFTNDSPASNIDRSGYGTTSSGGAEEETHPTIQDITKYQKSGSAVVAAPRQIGRKRNIRRIIGVVLHITRGGPARNAIRQVTDEDRRTRASFHTVIDRTGKPTHVVPYEYASFHAGGAFEVLLETRKGAFKGKTIRSINSRTIGIEIANYGPLVKVGDRTFKLKEKQLDPETGNRIPLDTPILGQDLTGKDIELVDTGQKKRVDVGEGRTETLRVYHEKITDAQYETLVQELIAISKLEIPLNLIGHRHLSEKSLKPDPPWRPFLQRLENDEQLKNRGVVTYPDPLSIQDAWGFD
ncbi:MAG: RHS repeat-associated core domain-containing protein, partial [Acidiferrobacterales bacterium]